MYYSDIKKTTTKKMLGDSLKKLMISKPLNKISIQEIVNGCGVNRQTFYYHFHDIYDLLEWLYLSETASLLDNSKNPLTINDGILNLLKYIRENKELCLCTLNSIGHSHLRRFFYDGINHVIMSVVNERSQDLLVSDEHKKFIAHFYTVSFAGFIESWLEGGLKEDPDDIIKLCGVTMNGNIRGALERFSNKL